MDKEQPKASYRDIAADLKRWGVIGVNLVFVLAGISLDMVRADRPLRHDSGWRRAECAVRKATEVS